MPPRYAYWTIIAGGLPTAFRAAEREELLPTFQRIREKHPDAQMKWFARGKLWDTQEAARARPDDSRGRRSFRDAGPGEPRDRDRPPLSPDGPPAPERRGRDWRPGGEHRDPRQKFIDQKKQKNAALRQDRWQRKNAAPEGSRGQGSGDRAVPGNRPPGAGDQWRDRQPANRGAKPYSDRGAKPVPDRGAKPYGDRSAKPFPDRGATPYGDRGAKPVPDRGATPYGDRSAKPFPDRGATPYGDRSAKPFPDRGATPYGDRSAKPFPDRGATPYGDRSAKPFPDRGATPYGDRSAKPFPDRGKPDRPWQDRSQKKNPPFADRGAKPDRPWHDRPRDPSRRDDAKPFGDRRAKPFPDRGAKPDARGPKSKTGWQPHKPPQSRGSNPNRDTPRAEQRDRERPAPPPRADKPPAPPGPSERPHIKSRRPFQPRAGFPKPPHRR